MKKMASIFDLKKGDMLLACASFEDLDPNLIWALSAYTDSDMWGDSPLNVIVCGDICLVVDILYAQGEKARISPAWKCITILHNDVLLKICHTDSDFDELWMIME
jgi:hypothetical protein